MSGVVLLSSTDFCPLLPIMEVLIPASPQVHGQRKAFKKSQLSSERIERLNSIGFYWTRPNKKKPPRQDSASATCSPVDIDKASEEEEDEIGAIIYEAAKRTRKAGRKC